MSQCKDHQAVSCLECLRKNKEEKCGWKRVSKLGNSR